MQWLIDIITERVIATIGIPPVYIDRGDPAAYDFIIGNFTKDGAWHDLDLSGIVPADAQAITAIVKVQAIGAIRAIQFRKAGQSDVFNVAIALTQIGNILNIQDLTISLDANRHIEYNADAALNTRIDFTVKGWWL